MIMTILYWALHPGILPTAIYYIREMIIKKEEDEDE